MSRVARQINLGADGGKPEVVLFPQFDASRALKPSRSMYGLTSYNKFPWHVRAVDLNLVAIKKLFKRS